MMRPLDIFRTAQGVRVVTDAHGVLRAFFYFADFTLCVKDEGEQLPTAGSNGNADNEHPELDGKELMKSPAFQRRLAQVREFLHEFAPTPEQVERARQTNIYTIIFQEYSTR